MFQHHRVHILPLLELKIQYGLFSGQLFFDASFQIHSFVKDSDYFHNLTIDHSVEDYMLTCLLP